MRKALAVTCLFALVHVATGAHSAGGQALAAEATSDDRWPEIVVSGEVFSSADVQRAAEAQELANELDEEGRRRFEHSYGGLRLKDRASRVEVFLVTDDAEATRFFEGFGSSVRVTVREGTATAAEVAAVQLAVLEAVATDESLNRELGSIEPDLVGGTVRLRFNSASDELIVETRKRFGPHVVTEVREDRGVDFLGPAYDAAPWNGGIMITNGAGDCTAGVPTHNSAGQKFILTAGHCFAENQSVRNYSVQISAGGNGLLGNVISRDLRNYGYDAEVIAANSSDLSYSGGTNSTARAEFAGAGPTQVGSYVCHSGAFEGQRCSYVVGVSGCHNVFEPALGHNRYRCGYTYTHNADPQTAGPGDSGGPVYQWFGSTIKAVGLLSRGDGAGPTATCSNWSAQVYRTCAGNYWFTDIGPLLALWGLTVN